MWLELISVKYTHLYTAMGTNKLDYTCTIKGKNHKAIDYTSHKYFGFV